MNPACVIKLGGSLVGSAAWTSWCTRIASCAAGRAVVVPGGGPWADAVRDAQCHEKFDDREAHRRALRAMALHGEAICAAGSGYQAADSALSIGLALAAGKVAVWMPHDMAMGDASIAPTWDVTSDSLAAWLARRLRSPLLVLVKSIAHIEETPGVAELARRRWVDACFERYCEGAGFRVRALGKEDEALLEGEIAAGSNGTISGGEVVARR